MNKSFYTPNVKILDKLEYLVDILIKRFNEKIISSSVIYNELTVNINKENLLEVIAFLRDDSQLLFRQLTDITAVDYLKKCKKFTVVYQLLSLSFNLRIRIKIDIPQNYIVPSLFNYYSNADWLEREVFDMFGIYFNEHPDLRRILTDFGFEGHPLRKDFPLSGFTEVYYDENDQEVKYKPVELENEYRNFSSINPWMGICKREKD
ncbi:UNVERIFIED_CONTAM: hypothetical protein PYX00_011174 [Menopon gallinae]|uniref:NADH dehydrogenase [ubiquinone] iron-sulfur protein 3, mitochondrial n=1 Tax=Menopon gallinae TaxID=328185 RepID=A0AAW2H662_9NEOP